MYIFIPMSVEHAEEIAYNWKYEEQHSFYNMTEDEEDLQEFLNREAWKDSAYAVLNEQKKLAGFFQYKIQNSELVIRLGLKPELIGKGLGEKFVQSGLTFGISRFKDMADSITLTVASFNKRTIKIYQKLGFEIVKEELVHTNKKDYEFLTMKKPMPLDFSIIQDEKFIKETKRCILRCFEEKDLDEFITYRNNEDWMKYQGFKNLTKVEYRKVLLAPLNIENGIQLAIAHKDTDKLIGDIYLQKKEKTISIGYTINPVYSRKGYISEVLKALLTILQGYYSDSKIIATIEKDNIPSKNLLLKLGFTYDCFIDEFQEELYVYQTD